jgi:hypothetical protein
MMRNSRVLAVVIVLAATCGSGWNDPGKTQQPA